MVPVSNSKVGVPVPVVTVTTSENTTEMSMTAPAR